MRPGPLLLHRRTIAGRITQLGRQLTAGRPLRPDLVLILMDGAAMFAADLLRAVQIPELRVATLRAGSYRGTASTGTVTVQGLPPRPRVEGRRVLVLDDVLDSGLTLHSVCAAVEGLGAAAVATCVLLDKPGGRKVPMQADLTGFVIGNHFVVGYGMDLDGAWRHLPDIHLLAAADPGAPPSKI